MFVACGIWCLADVSSVSPSSGVMLLISTNGKTSLFDPHKFITNYLNTDLPTIPQSAPTKG